jgi:hypothetical protein
MYYLCFTIISLFPQIDMTICGSFMLSIISRKLIRCTRKLLKMNIIFFCVCVC